jgi:hypothetical protein
MAGIVLQKTKGTEYDLILYDDDTVTVDGIPVPNAVVSHVDNGITVALDPTKLTELQVDTREVADGLAT